MKKKFNVDCCYVGKLLGSIQLKVVLLTLIPTDTS